MSTLKVDTILKRTGTGTITLGQSGDTISIPSGATLSSAGTNTLTGIANTPSFSAKLSGDQTISSGSYTKISFASEEWDTGGAYDTSNYRWTPGEVGKFNVKILIMWNNVTAQNQKLQLAIYKNGSFYADVENIGSSATGADPTLMISLDLSLSATDYIEAYAYQSTGGGIEIVANYSWFQGQKILGA